MSSRATVQAAIGHVRELPDVHAATACARAVALAAAEAERTEVVAVGAAADALADGAEERWDTPLGNVREVLQRGARSADERLLLGSLVALGVHATAVEETQAARIASQLIWLATHTPCNALVALDAAAGGDAGQFWDRVAEIVGASGTASLADRLVGAMALRLSPSPRAKQLVRELEASVTEPAIATMLHPGGDETDSAPPLTGELGWRPRGALATTLFALSGWLFVRACLHLVARFALALRRPTELRLSERGLELRYRVEMLGRTLKQHETVVPVANLSRVSREVRYRQVGLYSGLVALALGTYLGVGLLVDGLRAPGGSPPLLALGAGIIVAGLVLDFLLSSLPGRTPSTVRLVVQPRAGSPLCVRGVDAGSADRTLRAIAACAGYQTAA